MVKRSTLRRSRSQRDSQAKRKQTERGQTLVEMSLTVVFLIILLSVVVDLGRIFFTYIALRDASQEGAAYASIDPFNSPIIEARVRRSSDLPIDLTSTKNISVTVGYTGGGCVGDAVQVTVTYGSYPLIMPFTGAFVGGQRIMLSASEIDTILDSGC